MSQQGLPGSPHTLYSTVSEVQVPAGVFLLISLWWKGPCPFTAPLSSVPLPKLTGKKVCRGAEEGFEIGQTLGSDSNSASFHLYDLESVTCSGPPFPHLINVRKTR